MIVIPTFDDFRYPPPPLDYINTGTGLSLIMIPTTVRYPIISLIGRDPSSVDASLIADRHDGQPRLRKREKERGKLKCSSWKSHVQVLCLILLPDRTAYAVSERDAFREMLDSVAANGHTFDECKDVLRKSVFLTVLPRIRV